MVSQSLEMEVGCYNGFEIGPFGLQWLQSEGHMVVLEMGQWPRRVVYVCLYGSLHNDLK